MEIKYSYSFEEEEGDNERLSSFKFDKDCIFFRYDSERNYDDSFKNISIVYDDYSDDEEEEDYEIWFEYI